MDQASSTLLLTGIYIVAVIVIGAFTARWIKSGADFMIGGRELGWVVSGFAISAINFSGASLPLQIALGYQYGWPGVLYMWSYIITAWIWVPILIRFWRRMGAYTQPEWVEYNYGLANRVVLVVAYVLVVILASGVQLVGLGSTVAGLMGVAPAIAVAVLGAVIVGYAVAGGMWAVVLTDLVQAVWVMLIVGLAIPIVLIATGGLGSGFQILPEAMRNVSLDSLPVWALSFPSVLSLFTVHLLITSMGHIHLRATSIRSEKDIYKAWGLAGVLIFLTAGPFVWLGIYTRTIAPNIEPALAFGRMLQEVPPVLAALAVTGVLAATMSTFDSILISGSNAVVRDIAQRLFQLNIRRAATASRIAMATIGAVAVIAAVSNPTGIGDFFILFTAIAAPILAIHLDNAYLRKGTKEGGLFCLITVVAFAIYWQVFTDNFTSVATVNIAIPLAFISLYVGSFLSKLTGPWWKEEGFARKTLESLETDKAFKYDVLSLIANGTTTLAELADAMDARMSVHAERYSVSTVSVPEMAAYLDELIEKGDVQRDSQSGRGLVTYGVTESAESWLEESGFTRQKMGDREQAVLETIVSAGEADVGKVTSSMDDMGPGEVVALFNQLNRRGYGEGRGLLRYRMKATSEGREALKDTKEEEVPSERRS